MQPDLAWRLAGLGWQVAGGFGLTETSPILTLTAPGSRVIDTAGKALPGVRLRGGRSAVVSPHPIPCGGCPAGDAKPGQRGPCNPALLRLVSPHSCEIGASQPAEFAGGGLWQPPGTPTGRVPPAKAGFSALLFPNFHSDNMRRRHAERHQREYAPCE